MRYAHFALILLLLPLLSLVPVHADSGGPDPQGYTFIDSEEPGGPAYAWEEVSGPGQPLAGLFGDPDNGYAGPIPLDFPFPYYGQLYDGFYVYANGYIQLTHMQNPAPPGYGGTLPPMPSPQPPNTVLAPFSTDLYLHPDISQIYYHYDSANRRGIIEFVDLQWCCGLNTPHTFEIILHLDGRILIQYQQVRFLSNPHTGYVAGIEGPNGIDGLGYAAGFVDTDPTVHNDLAVLYNPGPDIYGFAFFEAYPDTQCEDAGLDMRYWGEVTNLTGYTTTFTLTHTVHPTTWGVTMPDVVGPINNAAWLTFPITVSIPISATFDDSAWVTVTAVAAMSPSIPISEVSFWAGVADRDLALTKTLAPDTPPGPGGLFRYALTVDNGVNPDGDCGAEARDIVLTETLPAGMELVEVYPPPVTTPTQVITWTLGSIDSGDAATFYVELRAPTMTTVPTYLTNTARVTTTGSVERGPFDNNVVTYTTVVTDPWLDLWVVKYVDAGSPIPGSILTYGIDYANGGNVPLAGAITLTDRLPDGATPITATAPFTWNDHLITWTLDYLDNQPWDPETVYVTVQLSDSLPDGYVLTDVVEITACWPLTPTLSDVYTDNNRYVLTLTVQDLRADVWVEKYLPEIGGAPVIPEPGGDYTYWIHYGNDGSAGAITVTLTDTLPLSTSVLFAGSASGAAPVLTETGHVVWPIPALAPGAESWTRITLLLDEAIASGTVLTNSVSITNALGYNITPTNDSDLVTVTLLASDVTITKTAIPTGAVATGDTIVYVLRYSNVGPLAASAVVIDDPLPEGLAPVSVMTTGASLHLRPATRYTWDVDGELAQGEGGIITITAWVQPSFPWTTTSVLTNTAHISTTRGEGCLHAPNQATVVNPVLLRWQIYLPLIYRSTP